MEDKDLNVRPRIGPDVEADMTFAGIYKQFVGYTIKEAGVTEEDYTYFVLTHPRASSDFRITVARDSEDNGPGFAFVEEVS